MQPRDNDEGDSGKSNDETVIDITNNILENLPKQLDINEAGPDTFILDQSGVLESLASFLKQEI